MSRTSFIISNNSITKKSETSYNDLNDIFYIFKKAINATDSFFNLLFSTILFCIKAIFTKKKYIFPKMCFYSIFVIVLFSFSQSQYVPIDLIINAYFNKSQIIHISYDNIIKSNKNNFDNAYKKSKAYDKKIKYIDPNGNCNEYNYYDINNNNNYNDGYILIQNNDFYLFNFIPLITSLITFISFFFLYITIKITYYSKISNSFMINIIGLYLNYKIVSYLYSSSFYIASGFIFILFLYFYKCSIDSLYCIFKFNRNDFEIYSIRLCADNIRQFWLKFTILFFGTLLSGFLSMNYFKLFFNYIAFYLCLFTLIIFLCNCLEKNYLVEYKYSKSILIFILGNVNFAVNKLLRKKYYEENDIEPNKINDNIPNVNSFYFISDLFSLFCFDYIDDYIEYKYQYYLSKKKKIKKIFNLNDFVFILLFVVFLIISIYGIIFKEYISYFIALILAKKFNKYFPSIFNYSIGRIFNHFMVLIFIFEQYEISTTGDEYIINTMINLILGRDNAILLFKFIGLLFFLINLVNSNYLYYYSDDCHQNLYRYFKTFNEFRNISDILENNTFENDNDNDNDETNSDDEDFLNLNIDEITNLYRKKYKIKIIANNTSYIKIKRNLFAIDFSLCYLDMILTTVFAVYYEYNVFLKILYIIIICFLLSRKFFLLNEIKGNVFYFIYYVISFIFSSRLIFFTCIDSFYFTIIMHLNMFSLLTYYCFSNRRNLFVTIFIILHLFIAYYQKLFTFLLFNLVFVILTLIFMNFRDKEKYRIEKYDGQNSKLSLIFLLSLMTFFLIQLYGINNLLYLIQSGYDYLMNLMDKISLMLSSKNNGDIRLIEYYIITDIIDWIDHILQ